MRLWTSRIIKATDYDVCKLLRCRCYTADGDKLFMSLSIVRGKDSVGNNGTSDPL
jgi:hypothetical protein